MSDILNCIIFYNNYEEVSEYIKQLEKQTISNNIKLAITVNKDTKNKSKLLSSSVIDIMLFDPQENLGYLNGMFYGYNKTLAKNFSIKWVILSNTDIEILDLKLFEKIIFSNYSTDIFCVAPSVYEKNNKVYENPQYYKRYTPKSLRKRIFIFSHPTFSKYYLKLSSIKSKLTRRQKQASSYVYSAHGSFFILKSSFLNSINRNYMSLLYSEEAFIAEEVRLAKGRIFYDSSLEVIHNESQTTSKLGYKRKSKLISESLKKIYQHYFSEDLT